LFINSILDVIYFCFSQCMYKTLLQIESLLTFYPCFILRKTIILQFLGTTLQIKQCIQNSIASINSVRYMRTLVTDKIRVVINQDVAITANYIVNLLNRIIQVFF
jgi:hypothetical protein